MITFTSFPTAFPDSGYARPIHYGHAQPEDMDVDDLDDIQLDHSNNLTCPGESLTSSQAFMR